MTVRRNTMPMNPDTRNPIPHAANKYPHNLYFRHILPPPLEQYMIQQKKSSVP